MVWYINDISSRKLDWQLWYVAVLPLFYSSLRLPSLICHIDLKDKKRRRTKRENIYRQEGADLQVEKYDQGHFGACPRVFCHATHVLPCGRADIPGLDTIKLYCPNCGDIYSPPSSKYASVDGESFLPFPNCRESLSPDVGGGCLGPTVHRYHEAQFWHASLRSMADI
jgi:hypothetical protein